ncbi:GNAT family N-acetyltransferase [Paenibacillus koleovorans]|uniref:GNAT family N-acetyltransferase n=1 Tax=Paenibacillus koleovorans TaxID=121608 RepID=UPI000FD80AF3|nr:GNAT family N-acetyltransferase [Paenibacillus koleovorans]
MIRTLMESDLEDCLALTEFSFRLKLSEKERALRLEQMKGDFTLGYYSGSTLAAKLTILPLQLYLGGRRLAMGGVASVATWPEFRRKGMVGELLSRSLGEMREQGQTVSVLNPFSFFFYRKFGWGYMSRIKRYWIPIGLLKRDSGTSGHVAVAPMQLDEDTLQIVAQAYEAYAARYNGMLSRDADWWQQNVTRKKLGRLAIDYDANGQIAGYVMYAVKDGLLDVRELVYVDEPSRRRLLGFLAQHDSMAENVTFEAPADDTLLELLDEPSLRTELNACYMFRIVDLERLLAMYPFVGDGEEHRFRLEVTDRYAPWNAGSFDLTVHADGRAEVVREATSESGDASTDAGGEAGTLVGAIDRLSSLFVGFSSCSYYRQLGLLTASEETAATLDRLLPKKTPYLLDMF